MREVLARQRSGGGECVNGRRVMSQPCHALCYDLMQVPIAQEPVRQGLTDVDQNCGVMLFRLYSFFRVFELISMISMGAFGVLVWVGLLLGSIKWFYDDFEGGDQGIGNAGNFFKVN